MPCHAMQRNATQRNAMQWKWDGMTCGVLLLPPRERHDHGARSASIRTKICPQVSPWSRSLLSR